MHYGTDADYPLGGRGSDERPGLAERLVEQARVRARVVIPLGVAEVAVVRVFAVGAIGRDAGGRAA